MFEREFAEIEICFKNMAHMCYERSRFYNGKIECASDFIIIFDSEYEKEKEYVFKLDSIESFVITKKLKDINQ